MSRTYWWIRDANPAEVQSTVGMLGVPTPQGGTLVDAPPDPYIEALVMNGIMSRMDAALNPKPPRLCNCAVVHMPPCRFAYSVT